MLWTYNYDADSEIWYGEGYYDTKEEAIAVARRDAREHFVDEGYLTDEEIDTVLHEGTFFIGEAVKWEPQIDGDIIIENLQNEIFDECGIDDAGWLEAPSYRDREARAAYDKKVADLSQRLTEVFLQWCKEMGEEPNFYHIDNIRPVPYMEDQQ